MKMDANQLADSLGVTPLYMRHESERWSSAVQLYQDMLSNANSECASPLFPRTPEGTPERRGNPTHSPLPAADSASPLPAMDSTSPLPPALRQNRSLQNLISPGSASLPMSRSHLTMAGCFSSTTWSSSVNKHGSQLGSPGDPNSLELEAVAAVHELSFAVEAIWVSEMLPRTPELIFVNVTTVEGQPFCVELTSKGWRVTSLRHDCMNGDINRLDLHIQYFENIYSLMDQISDGYRTKFSEALAARLEQLNTQESASEKMPHLPRQESGLSFACDALISSSINECEKSEDNQVANTSIETDSVGKTVTSGSQNQPGIGPTTSSKTNNSGNDKNRLQPVAIPGLVVNGEETLSDQENLSVKVRVTVRHPSGEGKRQEFVQGSPAGRPVWET